MTDEPKIPEVSQEELEKDAEKAQIVLDRVVNEFEEAVSEEEVGPAAAYLAALAVMDWADDSAKSLESLAKDWADTR